MVQVLHREISTRDLPTLVREVNQALREIAQQATVNYFEGYPQVDAVVLSNTTLTIWLPLAGYVVESIAVRTSSGTASVTPRINGVDMDVAGGVPITATSTATSYAIDADNEVEALDNVALVVSGLGGGAWLSCALSVRRVR